MLVSVGDDDFRDAIDVGQTYGEPRVGLISRQTAHGRRGRPYAVHAPTRDTGRVAGWHRVLRRHVGRLSQRQVHVGHWNTWERKYIKYVCSNKTLILQNVILSVLLSIYHLF